MGIVYGEEDRMEWEEVDSVRVRLWMTESIDGMVSGVLWGQRLWWGRHWTIIVSLSYLFYNVPGPSISL